MNEENNNLPVHIGIIMDGNGRWATLRGKPRKYGHLAGSKTVEKTVAYAFDKGIKAVSLYAFSSENWNRPKEEVEGIFSLIEKFLKTSVKKLTDGNVKLIVSGSREGLPDKLIKTIDKSVEKTKNNDGGILNVAVNYGGRADIVNAVNKLIKSGKTEITENDVSGNLSTAGLPPLDFIIRTAGEKRLSNFMLFEASYSELYFTDVLWPDFTKEKLDEALQDYRSRKRNFGGITENA